MMLKTIAMTTTLMAAGSQATFIHPLEEYDMAQIGVPGCPPHQTVVHDIEECRIVAEGMGMGLDWFADTNNDSHDPAGCFFGNFGGTRMAFFNSGRGTKHPARGSVCRTLTCEEGNRAYYGDKVYHLPDIGDGMLPESQRQYYYDAVFATPTCAEQERIYLDLAFAHSTCEQGNDRYWANKVYQLPDVDGSLSDSQRQYYYDTVVATPTCAAQERIYLDLAFAHSTCEQGNDRYWANKAYQETQGLHAQKQQAYDFIVALSTCAEQEVAYGFIQNANIAEWSQVATMNQAGISCPPTAGHYSAPKSTMDACKQYCEQLGTCNAVSWNGSTCWVQTCPNPSAPSFAAGVTGYEGWVMKSSA